MRVNRRSLTTKEEETKEAGPQLDNKEKQKKRGLSPRNGQRNAWNSELATPRCGWSLGLHLFVVTVTDGVLDGAEAISLEELHQFLLDAAHQPGSLVHQTLVVDDNTTIRQHARSDSRTGAR